MISCVFSKGLVTLVTWLLFKTTFLVVRLLRRATKIQDTPCCVWVCPARPSTPCTVNQSHCWPSQRAGKSCQNIGLSPCETHCCIAACLQFWTLLGQILGWQLAQKQIAACQPCRRCLMGEMSQPASWTSGSHTMRSRCRSFQATKKKKKTRTV